MSDTNSRPDDEAGGLDQAADELYTGDPAEFIGRRDALVKQARAAKDRPLAEAIKALRRPSMGAWYMNLAARAGLPSLAELLDLGDELRDAQARLDAVAVVSLGPARAQLERRVLSDVSRLVAARGGTASAAALEEVRSTLRAALADPDAAAAVKAGRLDKALEYGAFDVFGALAAGMVVPDPTSTLTSTDAPDEAPSADDSVHQAEAGGRAVQSRLDKQVSAQQESTQDEPAQDESTQQEETRRQETELALQHAAELARQHEAEVARRQEEERSAAHQSLDAALAERDRAEGALYRATRLRDELAAQLGNAQDAVDAAETALTAATSAADAAADRARALDAAGEGQAESGS